VQVRWLHNQYQSRASAGEQLGQDQDGLGQNSRNSSKPPSSDSPFVKPAPAACAHFVANANPRAGSIGTRLLADLRDVFTARNADRLPTTVILDALHAMDEAPWNDFYGKPFDACHLSKELGRYSVQVHPFKLNGTTVKGYQITGETGLEDAWKRYLPPPTSNPE
jgi:hypothetical protein